MRNEGVHVRRDGPKTIGAEIVHYNKACNVVAKVFDNRCLLKPGDIIAAVGSEQLVSRSPHEGTWLTVTRPLPERLRPHFISPGLAPQINKRCEPYLAKGAYLSVTILRFAKLVDFEGDLVPEILLQHNFREEQMVKEKMVYTPLNDFLHGPPKHASTGSSVGYSRRRSVSRARRGTLTREPTRMSTTLTEMSADI